MRSEPEAGRRFQREMSLKGADPGSSEDDRDNGHRAAGELGAGSRLRRRRRGFELVGSDRSSRNDFVRVDSVHQGDLDGRKGVHEINLVDEVTQYEFVGAVEAISERFLIPVLAGLLDLFPFVIKGFHADNGSEYVNRKVAASTRRTASPPPSPLSAVATALRRLALRKAPTASSPTISTNSRIGPRHGTSPFVQAHFGIGIDWRGTH